MEFKKSEFPKVLEAYAPYKGGKAFVLSEIVNNKTEEASFIHLHLTKNHEIKERKLNDEELSTKSFTEKIIYKIPNWIYVIISILLAVIIALIGLLTS